LILRRRAPVERNAQVLCIANSPEFVDSRCRWQSSSVVHGSTLRLWPALAKDAGVVTVTSVGHRMGKLNLEDLNFASGGFARVRAYSQSKLANMSFTVELGRRLAAAADPVTARTELGSKQTSGGWMRVVVALVKVLPVGSAATGAAPTLRAATDLTAQQGELFVSSFNGLGAPVRKAPSADALDPVLARELWTRSLQMLEMTEPPALRSLTGFPAAAV
jgi:protochlorophyllide reductase